MLPGGYEHHATLKVDLLAKKAEFSVYSVRIPEGKSAKIAVNRNLVEVSCHGLAKHDFVSKLESGKFLVEMRHLAVPAIPCRPNTSKKVMDGVEFVIENDRGNDSSFTILVDRPELRVQAELE